MFSLYCVVQVISRTNELMENSNEQRRKQEKILEERQDQINKLEATMKSVSAEVIKVCLYDNFGSNEVCKVKIIHSVDFRVYISIPIGRCKDMSTNRCPRSGRASAFYFAFIAFSLLAWTHNTTDLSCT